MILNGGEIWVGAWRRLGPSSLLGDIPTFFLVMKLGGVGRVWKERLLVGCGQVFVVSIVNRDLMH